MNRTRQRAVAALVIVAGLLLPAGCVTRYPPLNLWYDPAVTGVNGDGATVALVKFTDLREDVDTVFFQCTKNRDLTRRWAIHGQDAGAWVANALAEELEKAGFVVTKYKDAPAREAKLVVNGILYESYFEWYQPPTQSCGYIGAAIAAAGAYTQAWVKTHVAVEWNGIPVMNKQYIGRAKMGQQGRPVTEQCMNRALQDVMKKLVPDLVAIAQQGGGL